MSMTQNEALGMFIGLFVGDAMGAPLEFTRANMGAPVRTMIGGGVHNVAKGEWTDDGAMAVCIADAYLKEGGFNASTIQSNFIKWKDTGLYGTRNEIFDIGMTVMAALNRVKNLTYPYAGSTEARSSGNGCIMRLAPCIAWNRGRLATAREINGADHAVRLAHPKMARLLLNMGTLRTAQQRLSNCSIGSSEDAAAKTHHCYPCSLGGRGVWCAA